MRTREVIRKVKAFRDYYGFDIVCPEELKTKEDCKRAIVSHRRWQEEALSDALSGIDSFIRELGLEWVDM